jgi:hypothetical protein
MSGDKVMKTDAEWKAEVFLIELLFKLVIVLYCALLAGSLVRFEYRRLGDYRPFSVLVSLRSKQLHSAKSLANRVGL